MSDYGIIDCDVHPTAVGGLKAVAPYMPDVWRKRMEVYLSEQLGGLTPGRGVHFRHSRGAAARNDAMPPGGGPAGSDPAFLARHHLDRHGIDAAILLPLQAAHVDRWTEVEEAAVIVSAFNDYMIDTWLPADPRFRLAIVVSPHDPELAAQEIRRLADVDGVVAVWLPLISTLLGNRFFHPIYAVAEERGLPVVLHVTGGEADFHGTPEFAGGTPLRRAQRYVLNAQIAMSNVTDVVFEGTFEKFPRLKFVFAEFGWTWVPFLLWRMDATWKSARHIHYWMTRSPSEYVLGSIRFTSEPALDVPTPEWECLVLDMMHADRCLLFSSDYPHWDADEPSTILKNASPEVRRRIFRDNALDVFGARLSVRQQAGT